MDKEKILKLIDEVEELENKYKNEYNDFLTAVYLSIRYGKQQAKHFTTEDINDIAEVIENQNTIFNEDIVSYCEAYIETN